MVSTRVDNSREDAHFHEGGDGRGGVGVGVGVLAVALGDEAVLLAFLGRAFDGVDTVGS
jgi:hypothetical protein